MTFQVHYLLQENHPDRELLWDGHPERIEGLKAAYADFENHLRTSGEWDTVIDACLSEEIADDRIAGSAETESVEAVFGGGTVMVTPAWKKIIENVDPNGPVTEDLSSGCDFVMVWNFNHSEPAEHHGLTRHETLHALGVISHLGGSFTPGVATINWYGGGPFVPAVHDLALVDMAGTPLVSKSPSGTGFELSTAPAFDASQAALDDDAHGIRFRGIGDDGEDFFMPVSTVTSQSPSYFDFSHSPILMYRSGHPTYHTIDAPDRAWFRTVGYTVADDLP